MKQYLCLIIMLSPLLWRGAGGEVFSQTDNNTHTLYLSALTKDSLKNYTGALADLDNALTNAKNN
ncbi:MAG: hypothetical protein ACYDCN_15315, partial [Bacteroidia bacterium]